MMPKLVDSADLSSCFGHLEMEAAVARMLNLARERGTALSESVYLSRNFDKKGYEHDGFEELVEYGWLEETATPSIYVPSSAFIARLRERRPTWGVA